jgi:hypothetical protein
VALNPTDPNKSGETNGAAKPSTEDEILMREIDEAVRKDDAQAFVKKYGLPVGSVLAVFLAGLGFYLLYWVPSQERAHEADSETIIQSLDASERQQFDEAAKTAQGLVNSENAGARTSARFILAGVALEQKKIADAVKLYKQIADDPDAPPAMRDLARVREVAANYDDRKPADVIARLSDLAVPGNPFFGSAGELVAIAHLEAGDKKKAAALFAQLAKDENVPESLQSRARQMAGYLGVDAIDDVEKLLKDQGVTAPEGDGAGEEAGAPASE